MLWQLQHESRRLPMRSMLAQNIEAKTDRAAQQMPRSVPAAAQIGQDHALEAMGFFVDCFAIYGAQGMAADAARRLSCFPLRG